MDPRMEAGNCCGISKKRRPRDNLESPYRTAEPFSLSKTFTLFFKTTIAEKAQRCAGDLRWPTGRSCWCKTPSSSTDRRLNDRDSSRFWMDARTSYTVHAFSEGPSGYIISG